LIEIGIHSLHLNIQFLPLVPIEQILKNQIIEFAGAVVILVGLLVFCLSFGFQFQIRQEEIFLIERYGDMYRKYMAQVNRYI